MPRMLAVIVVLATAGLGACSGEGRRPVPETVTVAAEPGPPWVSAVRRHHSLAGRIWRPSENAFVDRHEVLAALAKSPFVLVGEKHDNVDHHAIQAWLLARLMAGGRRPTVAFEMLTTDQEARLADYLAAHPRQAAGLGDAVAWGKSGWTDWSTYRPIAQAALDGGAPIVAAGLARKTLRAIAEKGIEALDDGEKGLVGPYRALPPRLALRMKKRIVESHCHMLPAPMIDPMLTVQTVKDAAMAAPLVRGGQAAGRDGAVLIAGNGHVRDDLGVPWHLRRMAPGKAVATIGLLEVEEGVDDPSAYAAGFGGGTPPFTFLWFSPRVDNTDPCEKYAEQLRRMGKKRAKP